MFGKKKPKKNSNPPSFFNNDLLRFTPEAILDFHTFGLLTSFEIEKYLKEFLEDSYIQKLQNVLVITGKGEVVRPAVLKLLDEFVKEGKFIESFKTAGYFTGQSGAFEIILKNS